MCVRMRVCTKLIANFGGLNALLMQLQFFFSCCFLFCLSSHMRLPLTSIYRITVVFFCDVQKVSPFSFSFRVSPFGD